jgi:hypothetical protein
MTSVLLFYFFSSNFCSASKNNAKWKIEREKREETRKRARGQ